MAADDAPFFLYLAHTAPHWPLHARAEDIARYAGRYDDGWQALRDARYARQVEMGLINPATHPLPELMGNGPHLGGRQSGGWDRLSDAQKAIERRKFESHAAMVDRMDRGLGDVLAALRDTGELDNTLIIFLSDNGASPETPSQPGYDRPSALADGTPIEYGDSDHIGDATSFAGIGSVWANAANTPFRYWKAQSFEGGVHTPMIVHWPASLKLAAGSLNDTPVHTIDLAPTILAAAGLTPANMAGENLLPLLRGEAFEADRPLYFEHEGGRAVREGT